MYVCGSCDFVWVASGGRCEVWAGVFVVRVSECIVCFRVCV